MKRKVLYLIMCFLAITFANAQITSVAIVGEAVGGWPGDPGNPGPVDVHQMASADGINWTISGLVVTSATVGGGAKFRANNSWNAPNPNWGGLAFPAGTATLSGPNIPTIAGTWDVSFNSTTGAYSFSGGTPIATVHIFGTAVNGPPEGLQMTTADAETYTLSNITLMSGTAQFDIDGSVYGGDTFPTGTVSDATLFIPVQAGTYTSVSVNISTGDYSFVLAPVFPAISIVGSGTPGGWPNDPQTDPHQLTTTDGITYKLEGLLLSNGEVKFRENNSWNANNWGGTTFPTGTGVLNSPNNIPTTAGLYTVTFNRTTLDYSFSFDVISIVGTAVGGWPGSAGNPGPTDIHPLNTTDGINYTLNGLVITDGEAKFRLNNLWDTSWGDPSTPSGNIVLTAGTYDITFNRTTGQYTFTLVLATTNFSGKNFKVYPNPTSNSWNFSSANEAITSIQIVDVLGKVVLSKTYSSNDTAVNASALTNGIYFARIASANATQTIKLVKN